MDRLQKWLETIQVLLNDDAGPNGNGSDYGALGALVPP